MQYITWTLNQVPSLYNIPAPRQTAWSNRLTLGGHHAQPTPSAQIMHMLLSVTYTVTAFGKQNNINAFTKKEARDISRRQYLMIIVFSKLTKCTQNIIEKENINMLNK